MFSNITKSKCSCRLVVKAQGKTDKLFVFPIIKNHFYTEFHFCVYENISFKNCVLYIAMIVSLVKSKELLNS